MHASEPRFAPPLQDEDEDGYSTFSAFNEGVSDARAHVVDNGYSEDSHPKCWAAYEAGVELVKRSPSSRAQLADSGDHRDLFGTGDNLGESPDF